MESSIYSGMKTPPCKDCEKRAVGCHGKCEAYQEFCKYRDAVRDEQYKKRETAEYFINNARKQAQKRRKKK